MMIVVKQIARSILLSLSVAAGQAFAGDVRIAVAANFTGVMKQVAPLFEQVTGHRTIVSYGSTGKLYSQIENGAPYDIYLAADTARPILAQDERLAVADSHFVYAIGKLVLWSPHADISKEDVLDISASDFNHIAIANPKTAPYGLAAQQVMEQLGVWEDIQPNLVRGDSISQTFQFVATENAEVGFVALSQVKAWKDGTGKVWKIPETLYSPIEQGAVLLERGRSNPASKAFITFLKSDTARKVIESFGYGTG